jgi:hypothetical protein
MEKGHLQSYQYQIVDQGDPAVDKAHTKRAKTLGIRRVWRWVLIAALALYILVSGLTILYLLRNHVPQSYSKSWHIGKGTDCVTELPSSTRGPCLGIQATASVFWRGLKVHRVSRGS